METRYYYGGNLDPIFSTTDTTLGDVSSYGLVPAQIIGVDIGSAVVALGVSCFAYCESLTSINIPSSVTTIGNYCFSNCSSLTSIDIPLSVTTIGNYCFNNCSLLASITFDADTTIPTFGDYCFSNCSSLTSIDIPLSVTTIGNYCFADCADLTSIDIPLSVTTIGMNCFINCSLLASITFNADTTIPTFGDYCFTNCDALTSIDIPLSVTTIGNYCFANCADLTSIDIPLSVTTIGNYCFYMCSLLASVSFNASTTITTFDASCFANCGSLISINIPSTITSLGVNCFGSCTSLGNITVPRSVASIGNNCFQGCTALTTINYEDPSNITGVNLTTILSGNTSQATVNFYMTPSAPSAPTSVSSSSVYYTQYYTAGTTFNYINGGMPVICLDENTLVCIDLENNYVPIKDIKSGDMVVDYSGNLVPVLFNICSGETDKFVKISKDAIGTNKPSRDIFITKGHPVLTNGGREFPCQRLINNRTITWNTFDKPHSVYNICTEKRIFIKMENMYVCTWAKDEYEKFITKYNVVCRGRK
jgi:hypothetical protein